MADMKELKLIPIWCSEVGITIYPHHTCWSCRLSQTWEPPQPAADTHLCLTCSFLHPPFPLIPPPESQCSVLHTSFVSHTCYHHPAVDGGRAERPRGTHRYLLPHAGLGEVWFHAAANLPYDRLCWLTLVRPLACVQLVPNGAEKRDQQKPLITHKFLTLKTN